MKKIIWILLFIPQFIFAQKTHKVGPKETFYSIGRMYDVHPKELASYNNLPFDLGLKLDQVIKIPAKKTMQPLAESTAEKPVAKQPVVAEVPVANSGTPIYHKVQKKETLYHVATLYAPTTMDNIRKWNNLASDGLNEGMSLIVGYQKDNAAPSAKTVTTTTPTQPKTTVVKSEDNDVAAVKSVPVEVKPSPAVVKNQEVEVNNNNAVAKSGVRNFNGGKFRDLYNEANVRKTPETGLAASFKSTSGWEDGRYYCLHNSAPAGTVIKITNQSNQKVVYAKVLDVIPDLSQNAGLVLRLSNSACDELAVTSDRFDVSIQY
jgi:LysM repeat protein